MKNAKNTRRTLLAILLPVAILCTYWLSFSAGPAQRGVQPKKRVGGISRLTFDEKREGAAFELISYKPQATAIIRSEDNSGGDSGHRLDLAGPILAAICDKNNYSQEAQKATMRAVHSQYTPTQQLGLFPKHWFW